jgi:hypothetical protein
MEAASAKAGGGLPPTPSPQSYLHPAEHPIDGDVRCAVCRRFPLVGEQVTRHAARGKDAWACETCETSGRGARLGAVAGSDRVRSIGGAANVHRAA